jgi:ABC-2 type transport system ATP-binding protein
LLAMLFGLVLPDEGEVRLLGRTRAEAVRSWLDGVAGFVESPRFYPYLSGRRNLAILAGLDGGPSTQLVDEVLDAVGLTPAAGHKLRGYSLGMRQRLGLAAALLRRPRVLILDEPTNGLDPAGTRELHATLRGLARDGLAILMSSHDMTHVSELCDSVSVLARGRVAFTGSLTAMRDLAPQPIWRLATNDDTAAVSLALGHRGVKVVPDGGSRLSVTADRAQLDRYVIALGREGIAVRALSEAVSPLEALYFGLTEEPVAAESGQ